MSPGASCLTTDANDGKLLRCKTTGCSQTPDIVYNNGQIQSFDIRSDIFNNLGAQAIQFDTSGSNKLDIGNGNEGAYDIVAPSGTGYVYWTNVSWGQVRVGRAGNGNSASTFWTTSSSENTFFIATDGITDYATASAAEKRYGYISPDAGNFADGGIPYEII